MALQNACLIAVLWPCFSFSILQLLFCFLLSEFSLLLLNELRKQYHKRHLIAFKIHSVTILHVFSQPRNNTCYFSRKYHWSPYNILLYYLFQNEDYFYENNIYTHKKCTNVFKSFALRCDIIILGIDLHLNLSLFVNLRILIPFDPLYVCMYLGIHNNH